MRRVTPFSDTAPADHIVGAQEAAGLTGASLSAKSAGAAIGPDQTRFGYLFPGLAEDPAAKLPTSASTVQALKDLGDTMREPGTDATLDSDIPSAYSYFGQFVDHDIILMGGVPRDLNSPDLAPLPRAVIDRIRNFHSPWLDLETLYDEAPHVGDALVVGKVFGTEPRPPGKVGDFFDLPRTPHLQNPHYDRTARVGDVRNDETTNIGQLHVAFLRAHNAIAESGHGHCAARSMLRRYYQSVVIHDFLPRVADPEVVAQMLAGPWKQFDPRAGEFFMPLEFSGAAFRFGHSMVRNSYQVNDHTPASLLRLFNVLGGYPTLPANWIIQWEHYLEGGVNRARFIDTRVARGLFTLPGFARGDEIRLPVRTLLRGYQLGLPTGQAVAGALDLKPEELLSPEQIEAVAARVPGGAQLAELSKERVADDGSKWKLSARTPLWFYILAEAEHCRHVLGRGPHLGPVGSRLVAGVLVALVRRSTDSILKPVWPPHRDPGLKLSDLLRLARVL